MKDKNLFLKMSEILACGSDEIIKNVTLAIEDPKKYFNIYKTKLSERHIKKVYEGLPVIALADALIEKKLAWEVDWKEYSVEIYEIIIELLKQKNIILPENFLMKEGEYENLKTDQFLNDISKKLSVANVKLLHLDINSDSYVLIILPSLDVDKLMSLGSDIQNILITKFQ